jgi:hypothetical protein
MPLSIRRWGVGQLVATWAAYWVALGAVTLVPFARWVWDITQIPGQHGSAGLSVGDAGVTLTAIKDGVTVWTGVAPLAELALWVAGPPLALWLAWLVLRPSRDDADEVRARAQLGALPDAARGGWAQPITPASTPSPVERREKGRG